MRKPITIILALLIALSPVLAYAESINLAALLADKSNKNLGNENGVYDALYSLLVKANGENFPLNRWGRASTFLSKIITGEAFTPEETVYDESLSAYEKYFLLTLTNATLSDEEAEALTAILEEGLKAFPEDEQPEYYVGTDEDGYITGLIRQVMEKMGYQFEPETINDTLTLYAVKDPEGKVVLSAQEVLTSIPHATLMKLVPEEKKQESAAALAAIEASIPYTIDWKTIANGDDVVFDDLDGLDDFFEDSEDEDEDEDVTPEESDEPEKVELTEEQIAQWTEKWLKLFFACDAFDLHPDDDNYKLLTDALLEMTDLKPEITQEPEGGISLRFDASALPTATPAPSNSSSKSGSSSKATAKPEKVLVELPAQVAGYTGKYIIYVSKKTCTIAIIGRGASNKFTKKVKTFPTSIGKAGQTRDGIFWVTKKERWHSWSGSGSYSPYTSKQNGGSYIHGPMYTAKDPNRMIPSSYNVIGTKSSAGCLGTVCAAAGWIYYNCPIGTMVMIVNDGKFKSSKPKKIPGDQTYDPTESKVKATNTAQQTVAPSPTSSSSGGSSTNSTSKTASPTATPTVAPENTNSPNTSVSPDNPTTTLTNTDIRQVQALLTFYFAAKEYPEDFDAASIAAFDQEIADTTDERTEFGAKTIELMNKFRDAYTPADGATLQKPTTEDKDTVTALVNALMQQQEVKDKIDEVQTYLVSKGKLSEADKTAANGAYDEKTIAAVKSFQKDNNIAETGVADAATQERLKATDPTTTVALESITVNPTSLDLAVGASKTIAVTKTPADCTNFEAYEYTSNDSGIATVDESGNVTAVAVGNTTITVTARITKGTPPASASVTVNVTDSSDASGASAQAVADPDDEIAAASVEETPAEEAPAEEAPVEETPTEEAPAEETPVAIQTGDKGDAVAEVQALLVILDELDNGKGDTGAVDGHFGKNTAKAVSAFQGSNGLEKTGMVDNDTIAKLREKAKPTVKGVQQDLIALGSLSKDSFDKDKGGKLEYGVYDPKTKDAVADFQKQYNKDKKKKDKLAQNGIADEDTRDALAEAVELANAEPEVPVEETAVPEQAAETPSPTQATGTANPVTPTADSGTASDEKPSERLDDTAKGSDSDSAKEEVQETPAKEETKTEDTPKEEPVKEESKKEETKVEEAVKEEPTKEEAKAEEAKKEEPKKEEPKKEEPKKEEPKKEEPKKEEAKKEEAKKEEPKAEEPAAAPEPSEELSADPD